MKRAIIEGRLGGRLYSEQVDGTDCPWGSITVWEPPQRFAFAWLINATWQFEPDMSIASEVEVTFTPAGEDSTVVELVHGKFERMPGDDGATMRGHVDGEMGWNGLMELYKARVDK